MPAIVRMDSTRGVMIAVLLAVVPVEAAVAQSGRHAWQDGLCAYTVRFDPGKVDANALRNTAKLLSTQEATLPFAPFVDTPSRAAKLDPEGFERDCTAKASWIRTADFLPLPGLELYRDDRARQVDDACLIGGAKMRAYRDPSALRRFTAASPRCDDNIDALEGRIDLTRLWRERVREQCAKNANPADCAQRQERQGALPDGDSWKRVFLVEFGWNNCATTFASFNGKASERTDAAGQRLLKAFTKAYRVKESCDDP